MSFILLYDSVFDQQIPIKSLFEGIRLEYISCFQLWSVVINVVVWRNWHHSCLVTTTSMIFSWICSYSQNCLEELLWAGTSRGWKRNSCIVGAAESLKVCPCCLFQTGNICSWTRHLRGRAAPSVLNTFCLPVPQFHLLNYTSVFAWWMYENEKKADGCGCKFLERRNLDYMLKYSRI